MREIYPPQITSGKDVSFSYTFSPEHTKTFAVHRCDQCSHKFCAPIPVDIGINYRNVVDEEYLKHEGSRRLAAGKLLSTLSRYRQDGKLLDIGCATGDFLQEAKSRGFESSGLEPCAWSADIARRRGLTVYEQLLDEFARGHRDEYDIATLWGVIEHFADPLSEVERIHRILKPGGLLAIWTGDADSITSRLLGRKWWYWQGQHIQYFTRKSLDRLLANAGFLVVGAKLYPFAASYETLSNSLKRYRGQRLFTTLLKPAFAVRPTWYLRLPGEMFIIARKPSL